MNFAWSHIETTVASKLATFKKYKWRILAVTVFLIIFSPVVVVTYLSNQEQPLYVDDGQFYLSLFQPPLHTSFPKYYKVVLESVDVEEGTAHLRADLMMPAPDARGLLLAFRPEWLPNPQAVFVPKRLPQFDVPGLTNWAPEFAKIHKIPAPAEVLFGPFTIRDELSDTFNNFFGPGASGLVAYGPAAPRPMHGDWGGERPSDFSESAPTSTQADVSLDGIPWWYPFDEYVIAAQVDCVVVVTPDRKKYFNIVSDMYSFASKLPNFIVRNASAKDVEHWIKHQASLPTADDGLGSPDMEVDLKESIKWYRPDFWRDGMILLVLERPLFPRFFAAFFGVLALIWIGVLAKFSDPKQLSLNFFGYFLAMWTIRAVLAAGAPPGPLFMDYATLGLYALLIAVVAAKFIWIHKT